MTGRRDRVRLAVEVGVYLILGWVAMSVAAWLLIGAGGFLAGPTLAVFAGAILVNWIVLRIYINGDFSDIGLAISRASAANLLMGVAGGIGAACIAIVPGLIAGAARIVPSPEGGPGAGTLPFVTFFLAIGAAGEEILFRGYAFQVLIANVGPWTTILPVAALFAAMHSANPDASWVSLANTAGFGVLFGYAFLRSRDLWLPIGLHFGWNFTLPLFGANVSGLRIRVTGHELQWSAGALWSGGGYGPEAGILASMAMVATAFYLWKAPIRLEQPSALLDAPPESTTCEPPPSSPSQP